MSISGISSSNAAIYPSVATKTYASSASSKDIPVSSGALSSGSAIDAFIKYASEDPGKRMIDNWLKAHNLTQEDLDKMPIEKREAIAKQMQQDIENSIKKKMEEKAAAIKTNILI